jgi:hypothetical protein
MRGLLAFLMFRLTERSAKHFGRQSRMGDVYAASGLGLLLLIFLWSGGFLADALMPGALGFVSARAPKLIPILIWVTLTAILYLVLTPGRRYRRWAEEFTTRHQFAKDRPALVEGLAFAGTFGVLILSIVLYWWRMHA